MPFPVPNLQPTPVYVPPAIVRAAAREDIVWNRPVFKAPPLVVLVPAERRSAARSAKRPAGR